MALQNLLSHKKCHWRLNQITSNGTDSSGNNIDPNYNTLTSSNLISDSPRYSKCIYFNGQYLANESNNTIHYVDNFSWSIWMKITTVGSPVTYAFTVGRADAGGFGYGIGVHNLTTIYVWFGNLNWNISDLLENDWNHIAFTKSGTTIKLYKNGNLYNTTTFTGSNPTYSDGNGFGVGGFNYGTGHIYPFYGYLSDFRVYDIVLTDSEINELYRIPIQVTKSGKITNYELVEDLRSGTKFDKTGIAKCNNFNEFNINRCIYPDSDLNLYSEPDGSSWIKVIKHNNPSANLFSSTDDFTKRIDKSNLSFNAYMFNTPVSNWELMVKQKATSSSDLIKYRWIQSVNPFTATYNDTVASKVTKITTNGYSTFANAGGLYHKGGETYFVINNGTNGNWFGALGSWTAFQGGIPGYPNTTITTGYIELYMRVDGKYDSVNKVSLGDPKSQDSLPYLQSNEFIEI
jgi:hypothetical protein